MKTIRLGRNGDQPFTIHGEGVSGIHASITIDDYGMWTLKDMGSTNGTFVRDEENGDLISVSEEGLPINSMTFIVLAADNSTGCCFYARQATNPEDYFEEHKYIKKKKNEFDKMEDSVSKRSVIIRRVIFFSMLIFTIITFSKDFQSWCKNTLNTDLFMIYRGLSLLTMGTTAFYDAQGKKSRIKKLRKKFNHCPNPECDRRMSGDEIDNLRCNKCKK